MNDRTGCTIGGAVTYWVLPSPTRRSVLLQEMNERLIPMKLLPEPKTDIAALKATLTLLLPDGQGLLVRPMKRNDDGEGAAVVKEDKGPNGNTYTIVTEIRTKDGKIDHPALLPLEEHRLDSEAISQEFHVQKGLCSSQQIATMLAEYLERYLQGTPLKPCGGIYWIGRDFFERWRSMALAVEAASLPDHTSNGVYVIRHEADEDSTRAVCDGLAASLAQEVDVIMKEVTDGVLQSRGLSSREARAKELLAKVSYYENQFQVALAGVTGNIENLQFSLAQAAIAIAAQEMTMAQA